MKVSLFITCLVDQLYPEVGMAMATLLTRLGVEVSFNADQTCCGQPAFNSGYQPEARSVAEQTLNLLARELESVDYIVAPSGSCVTMIRKYYPELFADDPELKQQAESVGQRLYELSQFLVEVLGVRDVGAEFEGRVTYHDSCHLLRELGLSRPPRELINAVKGVEFIELDDADVCCGFGGTFAVKYPEISSAIATEKVTCIERSKADTVVACDASCLMQIGGMLSRKGSAVRTLHLAELLAGPNSQ
ncbi:MAG TPA: (Fe-S)-binding protein [Pyrinomonadaceae bacterium]|nr:(Fe-S)-binding protein [Pyrinomonadaceae bacterium]